MLNLVQNWLSGFEYRAHLRRQITLKKTLSQYKELQIWYFGTQYRFLYVPHYFLYTYVHPIHMSL